MEEKKLTDEEIVKVLDECFAKVGEASCEGCKVYTGKGLRDCMRNVGRQSLDLIHRLQDENKRKTDRLYEMCNNEHDKLMKIREQKAEIERLKEENTQLEKDVHDMSWIIKVHKYCVGADHCQNSSTREFELQQQVDELKEEVDELKEENAQLSEMEDYEKGHKEGYEHGAKTTAKEICLKIVKDQPQPIQEKWVEWFKKEYGVEVE